VDDNVKLRLHENALERGAVAYVGLSEFEVVAARIRLDVSALYFGIVEVVEVVNDVDAPRTLRKQTPHKVRPDEPRPARD
jgi:hypothetical protein